MRLGNAFERMALAPHVQGGGGVLHGVRPLIIEFFLFMVLLRPEHIERRKRLNSALFSKDCRAHERSRHNQANRERDSKGPGCEEATKVDRLLQHKREERRGKTHKDAGHIGTDRDKRDRSVGKSQSITTTRQNPSLMLQI